MIRMLSIGVAILVAGVVIAAPLGPLPGLFIGGVATEAPDPWMDTSAVHEIKLKVQGTLPRVVIIWVIQYEGDLYVLGGQDSGWVSMLGAGGPVEMRIEDETYALEATRVTQGWEPVASAYLDKYRPDYPEIVAGFPSIEEAEGKVTLYRLNRT